MRKEADGGGRYRLSSNDEGSMRREDRRLSTERSSRRKRSRSPLARLIALFITILHVVGFLALRWVSTEVSRVNFLTTGPYRLVTSRDKEHAKLFSAKEALSLDSGISPAAEIITTNPIRCESTVVLSHFTVWQSVDKRNFEDLAKQSLNFDDCMVIFSQPKFIPIIKRLRNRYKTKTVIIGLELGFLPASQIHRQDLTFWEKQVDIDLQYGLNRVYQHFWMGLSKTWFVGQAIQANWFKSEFFLYSEMARIADPDLTGLKLLRHPEAIPQDRVVWMTQRSPVDSAEMPEDIGAHIVRHPTQFFHRGWQGAAFKEAWLAYHESFAEMTDFFLEQNNWGIGEADAIMQNACRRHINQCGYWTMPYKLHRMLHSGEERPLWFMSEIANR